MKLHRWANHDASKSWAESDAGKAAKKAGKNKLQIKKPDSKRGKEEFLAILSKSAKINEYTIDGKAYCSNSHKPCQYDIKFLLDTCALQANYISVAFAAKLRGSGCFFLEENHTVCSPINECKCFSSKGLISF